MEKQYVVLGLGVFGSTVATTLEKNGCEVLAIDRDVTCVERIADEVTKAVVADVTSREDLLALGINEFDVAVVAIGTHLEEAVLATMHLKEMGVPKVIAKARNKEFKQILEKVGADQVIRAEKDMGERVARGLLRKRIVDVVDLDDENTIVEIIVPSKWIDKRVQDLNIRSKYQMNILGVRNRETKKIDLVVEPEYRIHEGDQFLVLGKSEHLDKFDNTK